MDAAQHSRRCTCRRRSLPRPPGMAWCAATATAGALPNPAHCPTLGTTRLTECLSLHAARQSVCQVLFEDAVVATGATPNLSNTVRSMPNIEWAAAWSAGPEIPKTMPDEVFQTLSPDAQHYCRFVHAVRTNDRLSQSVVAQPLEFVFARRLVHVHGNLTWMLWRAGAGGLAGGGWRHAPAGARPRGGVRAHGWQRAAEHADACRRRARPEAARSRHWKTAPLTSESGQR